MNEASRSVYIGTSGWHYRHWLGPFYPPGLPASQMLSWYAGRFQTVEVNNSFYRLLSKEAVGKWSGTVPTGFQLAVKGSRFITHMKKLKDAVPALEKFFSRADLFGKKLGPILFQLPPFWAPNLERFAEFLDILPQRHRYAFEFRNPGWHIDPVFRLLEKRRAAFCIFDLAGFTAPVRHTAKFAYVRLHGPGGKYQGSYTRQALETWARAVESWRLPRVYIYFDNDESGFAVQDALVMKSLLRA
ncbi:MAG TPA: DUF72 domain-containing protein [Bryobacteraceae bacterium]|nr:DUF72 domain-containing protein [Bryobacteraceae bacterium]